MKKHWVIVIDRQYGSGGREIGQKLAHELNIPFYDQELIMLAAKESGFDESLFRKLDEHSKSPFSYTLSMYGSSRSFYDLSLNDQLYLIQSKVIKELAQEGPCLIMGRCADHILRKLVPTITFFIHAPLKDRVERAEKIYLDDPKKTKDIVKHIDKNRSTYYNYYSDAKWGKKANYHLTINSSVLGVDSSVKVLKTFVDEAIK